VTVSYQWAVWLADVLRDAGCPVYEEKGWKTRGREGGIFEPRGLVLHHDASPRGETSNGSDVIINGRPRVPGPLSQLWLSYNGTWHICAAGRANHAGRGSRPGYPSDNANAYTIGIETDHTTNEEWTSGQYDWGTRGLVALCDKLGIRSSAPELKQNLFAHKEWAPDRKIDPDPLNMNDLRALILQGYPTTTPEGLFGMSELQGFTNTTPHTYIGDGSFRAIKIQEPDRVSLIAAPVELYHTEIGVTLRGTDRPDTAGPGDVVQLRLQAIDDYPGDKPTVVASGYPVTEVTLTLGDSYGNLSWLNSLKAASEANASRKLQLFVRPPTGKSVSVVKVSTRIVT
jgi:hypothetical protein